MPHAWRASTNPAHGGKDSMYGHACLPVGRDTLARRSATARRHGHVTLLGNFVEKVNPQRIALGTFRSRI